MTRGQRLLVEVALALSPRACRAVRREQWCADLRDAEEIGLSRWGVALGALSTSLVSGGHKAEVAAVVSSTGEEHFVNIRSIGMAGTQFIAAAVLTAALGAVATAAGVGLLGDGVQAMSRAVTMSSTPGPVTWSSLADEPAPEWTDTSKLVIAGTIDRTTGQITDIPR